MNLSDNGLDLIMRFEGCRLAAYQDSADVWTIGYGHTANVHPGMEITEAQARALLDEDVSWAERAVDELVDSEITQSQFDALVSFTFNLGRTNFAGSTLLREVNAGRHEYVPREITRWVHAGGKPLKGLARRRVAEAELYLRD